MVIRPDPAGWPREVEGGSTLGKPKTLSVFAQKKRRGEKIVLLTAYDLTSPLIARDGGVDAILVGDSLGMVVMGYDTTLPVTIDDMVHHCRSVGRARTDVPVIADMPYGSFHVSAERTLCHALRLVKEGGVSGVKIEGGFLSRLAGEFEDFRFNR